MINKVVPKSIYREEFMRHVYEHYPEFKDEKKYPHLMIPINCSELPNGINPQYFVIRDEGGKEAWTYLSGEQLGKKRKHRRSFELKFTQSDDDGNKKDMTIQMCNQCLQKCKGI